MPTAHGSPNHSRAARNKEAVIGLVVGLALGLVLGVPLAAALMKLSDEG